MSKYNKAFVPLIVALVYFLNTKYGIDIPVSESDITILVSLLTGFFVWLVPNKA